MLKVKLACSKCFSPSSSSVSCGRLVGLPIGANKLEGKGKGLFITTGTSIGFCCCSWTLGDGADTSAQKQILKRFPGTESQQLSYLQSN